MDIDKMIKDKTESFVGNGDYYFEYITPEDCKKIVEEALKQEQESPINSASKCYSEKDYLKWVENKAVSMDGLAIEDIPDPYWKKYIEDKK